MPWGPITDKDVLGEFTPDEAAALQAIQAQETLPDVLNRVIKSARGSIIAGGNRLGPEGTLPDQIIMEVIAIARWRWIASFPKLGRLATEARMKLHDSGMDTLRGIAKGAIKVEIPDSATALDVAGPTGQIQLASANKRKFSSKTLEGL